jgi:hypothetical protein
MYKKKRKYFFIIEKEIISCKKHVYFYVHIVMPYINIYFKVFCALFMFTESLSLIQVTFAAFKSVNQASMDFDSNGDGQPEVTLNSSGEFSIGHANPSSNLHLAGSMAIKPLLASDNIEIGNHSLVMADTSTGNINLELPNAATCLGRSVNVIKTSANNSVFLSTNTFINDGNMAVLDQGFNAMTVVSNGQGWNVGKGYGSSTVTSPLQISTNCILWLDANDFSTLVVDTSGNVEIWRDKSGKGYEANATALKPFYVDSGNGINGKPAISTVSTDGSVEHALSIDAFQMSGSLSLFCVSETIENQNNTATSAMWYFNKSGGSSNPSLSLRNGSGEISFDYNFNDFNNVSKRLVDIPDDASYDQPQIISSCVNIIDNKFNLEYYESSGNYVQATQSSANIQNLDTGSGDSGELTLFRQKQHTNQNRFFHGKIGEIIFYNKLLNDAEKHKVINYLKVKWGIQ